MNGYTFTTPAGLPSEDEASTMANLHTDAQELTTWLKTRLEAQGYAVEPVIDEDWGYCLMCSREPFLLWVGCEILYPSHEEPPSVNNWHCFAQAEVPFWTQTLKNPDTRQALTKLDSSLKAILAENPALTFSNQNQSDVLFKRPLQPPRSNRPLPTSTAMRLHGIAWKWLASLCAIPFSVLMMLLTQSGNWVILTLIGFIATPLYTLDLLPALRASPSWLARTARWILTLLQILFGLLAFCIGAAITVWILYNLFIERQPEFRERNYYAYLFPLIIMSYGLYWTYSTSRKFLRKPPPDDQQ